MHVVLGLIFTCLLSAPEKWVTAANVTNQNETSSCTFETFFTSLCGYIGRTVAPLECYRCNSTNHRECLEKFIRPSTLTPESCSDVPDAKYCIKTTGYYQGVVGDQRFCSAKDLGNWCEYVKNEEDGREYRTCVYTCSTDACNSANPIAIQRTVLAAILFLVTAMELFRRL